jgi:hypothetical protein
VVLRIKEMLYFPFDIFWSFLLLFGSVYLDNELELLPNSEEAFPPPEHALLPLSYTDIRVVISKGGQNPPQQYFHISSQHNIKFAAKRIRTTSFLCTLK